MVTLFPLVHGPFLVGGRGLDPVDGQSGACADVEPSSGWAVRAVAGRRDPVNAGGCLVLGLRGLVFVDEPGAVQGWAGAVGEPKPGSFDVHVEDDSSVLEALLPNDLRRVAW